MAYKPQQNNQSERKQNTGIAPNGVAYKYPVPEGGNQAARISLIVNIGTQKRFYEDKDTGEITEKKPAQQVVVFADLVDQVVDYGGDIGEKQYRLMLNNSFKGDVKGVDFIGMPPRDADGNIISGREWTFHPTSLLTKIAKATGCDNILGVDRDNNMDIYQLLGKAFYADVQVNRTDSGKKNDKGEPIIYNNVNFKGASKLPMVKGKPLEVEDLQVEPLILDHNNVTEQTVVYLRGKVLQMMKLAPEYQGSKLQKLVEVENTAPNAAGSSTGDDAPSVTSTQGSGKKAATKASQSVVDDIPADDLDSDPF
jgi:hypothetical protein